MDTLGNFLEECCTTGPKNRITTAALYDAYTSWCEDAGVRYPLTKGTFGVRLRERGFRGTKSGSYAPLAGLELREIDEDERDLAA